MYASVGKRTTQGEGADLAAGFDAAHHRDRLPLCRPKVAPR